MHRRTRTVAVLAALALVLSACADDTGDETEERFALCGNGVLDVHEQCDDGNRADNDACLSSCLLATCGDEFVLVGSEECDGRNLNAATGNFNEPFTCGTLGRAAGMLACTADCRFDVSGCGPAFTPTPSVTPTPTGQATLTPTTTATPTPTRNPMCGNMTVEPGETCDDGNEEENDPCPNDCTIEPCAPAGSMRSVRVDFAPPPFQDASSITLLITYPDGTVGIPGSGDEDSVGSRITQRQSGSIVTPNDLDHALRAVYSRPGRITPGRVFTLTFDDCDGALPPEAEQLTCHVVDCANSNGPLDGCACSVTETE
jgi:cysteine-rich repeat protein